MSEEDATSQDDDGTSGEAETTPSTDQPRAESDSENGTGEALEEEPANRSDGMEVDDELLDYVEDASTETLARELDSVRNRAESAEEEREELAKQVEDLEDRVKRIQADFQNYKKRTERRREEEAARATQNLIERLLPVRENLDRAINQDSEADIRDGVEATLIELDTVLENEGVTQIDPIPGDDVDPKRHEVVHREDEDADSIASVYRRGYEMSGTVIQAAQVTVGTVEESDTDGSDATDAEPDQEAS